MVRPIRLSVEPQRLTLAPADSARLTLVLRNTSDVVAHLEVDVRGLPPGGQAQCEPPTVKLLPGALAEVQLTLHLPAEPVPPAGTHVLGILARSPHRHEVSRCEEVQLEVPAQPHLRLEVEPELVRAGSRADYLATLVNDGNVVLGVALTGTDPEREVRLHFAPAQLGLQPGQTAHVAVRAGATRAWTGQDTRRALTLSGHAADVTASKAVAFVQPPRLPPVVLRSLAGVASLLVVVGAVVLAGSLAGGGDPGAVPAAPAAAPPSATAQLVSTPTPTPPPMPTTPPPPPVQPTPATPQTTGPPPPTTAPPSATSSSPTRSAPPPTVVPLADGMAQSTPRIVDGQQQWRERGFTVAAAPGVLASEQCAGATAVAVHGSGPGSFVTAATPADPMLCNNVALLVTFAAGVAPATGVLLEVVEPGGYRVTARNADGDLITSAAPAQALLVKLAPDQAITSLTLSADPEGAAPSRVGLSRLQFLPAH